MSIKELRQKMMEILNLAKSEERELTSDEQKRFDALKAQKVQLRELQELEDEEKDEEDVECKAEGEEPKDENPEDKPADEQKSEEEEQKAEEETPADEENPEDEEKSEETPADEEKEEEEKVDDEEARRRSVKKTKVNTMKENFSVIKALRSVVEGRQLEGYQAEVVAEGRRSMKMSGVSAGGQLVLPTMRGITAGTAGSGAEAVATDLQNMLAPLYTKSAFAGLGATMLDNLVGDVEIPVLGAGSAAWEGETDAAADASQTTKSVKLVPHRLATYTDISLQFLNQDSCGAEALIRADLARAIQDKLEQTVFGSSAPDDAPVGLFNGVTPEGSDLAYGDIIDVIAAMENKNVYNGKWLLNPLAKAALSKVGVKNAGDTASLGFVFGNGEILGMPAIVSGNVVSKGLAYANWEDLVVGQWGGLDITVDPYSQKLNGKVRIVINAYFDAKWRRQTTTGSGEAAVTTKDTISAKILH